MQLFYSKDLDSKSITHTFDKTESRHIVRVLRKKMGDTLEITNGKNQLFTAELLNENERKCNVKIISISTKETLRKQEVSIAIAPTKSNDRYEWFLEKATEIGIDNIHPILCNHSERKVIKQERLSKVIVTAMKQSLQFKLPILHELSRFETFINQPFNGDKFIAYCEESKGKTLQSLLKKDTNTLILIGPEGGFSPEEIKKALETNFIPVSLGNTRLRTETAGIVAVHTVSLTNQR